MICQKHWFNYSSFVPGSITDYLLCKGCEKANERHDKYLDVSLVVRDTGSLQEAFANFLKPELLEGDNGISESKIKEVTFILLRIGGVCVRDSLPMQCF